ncbi:MAG: thioredoxin [Candidatus Rokuibacteriota bacterium]
MSEGAGALHVTTDTFDATLAGAVGPVLLDFWAPWCGPCKAIPPMIDDLAREMAGQATICKVNVEAEPAIAERYGVQALPSLVFLKGGERVDTLVGRVPKAMLADRLRSLRD